jgi:putative ABC transport system substrate-binding protein
MRVPSALARQTRTIPIVFVLVSDPIGSGFAASLAYPRGNITGFIGNDPAIGGKWIELLKEIA